MHNNLGDSVNEAQYKAITHGEGAMLVLAGPALGKRSLSHRESNI